MTGSGRQRRERLASRPLGEWAGRLEALAQSCVSGRERATLVGGRSPSLRSLAVAGREARPVAGSGGTG
jgi:hypothetical protein